MDVSSTFQALDIPRQGWLDDELLAQLSFDGTLIGRLVAYRLVRLFAQSPERAFLDFNDYASLHVFLKRMREIFTQHCKMAAGGRRTVLYIPDLQRALEVSGFAFKDHSTLVALYRRHGGLDEGGMGTAQFLAAVSLLMTLMPIHAALAKLPSPSLSFDEFVQNACS